MANAADVDPLPCFSFVGHSFPSPSAEPRSELSVAACKGVRGLSRGLLCSHPAFSSLLLVGGFGDGGRCWLAEPVFPRLRVRIHRRDLIAWLVGWETETDKEDVSKVKLGESETEPHDCLHPECASAHIKVQARGAERKATGMVPIL